MHKPLTFFMSFFLLAAADAQTSRRWVNTNAVTNCSYSQQGQTPFSFTRNVASLGSDKQFAAGIYSEKRFLLAELGSVHAAVVLPVKGGSFGWNADYFGNSAYHETALGLAYGRKLGNRASVGVQFTYLGVAAAGYGSTSTFNPSIGALFYLTPLLTAGLHAYNPVKIFWGKAATENWPSVISVGLGFDVSKQVFVAVEIEKEDDLPVSINTGFQYLITDQLIAKAGIVSASALYYLGAGVQRKNIRFEVITSVHPYLGITPGLLLFYQVNK